MIGACRGLLGRGLVPGLAGFGHRDRGLGTCGAGSLGCGDRRLERGHQVDELAALLGLLDLDRLPAFDLGLDDLLERLAVLVLVLAGVELAGHRGDQLLGHRELGRLEGEVFLRQVQLLDGADLVRPVERRQEHRLVEWVERGQRLAVLDHDLADRGQAVLLEDRLQQVERLAADLVGLDVVGRLHEPNGVVIAFGLGELLDLDRPDGLERHLLEVLVGDDHVLAGEYS